MEENVESFEKLILLGETELLFHCVFTYFKEKDLWTLSLNYKDFGWKISVSQKDAKIIGGNAQKPLNLMRIFKDALFGEKDINLGYFFIEKNEGIDKNDDFEEACKGKTKRVPSRNDNLIIRVAESFWFLFDFIDLKETKNEQIVGSNQNVNNEILSEYRKFYDEQKNYIRVLEDKIVTMEKSYRELLRETKELIVNNTRYYYAKFTYAGAGSDGTHFNWNFSQGDQKLFQLQNSNQIFVNRDGFYLIVFKIMVYTNSNNSYYLSIQNSGKDVQYFYFNDNSSYGKQFTYTTTLEIKKGEFLQIYNYGLGISTGRDEHFTIFKLDHQ